MYRFHLFLILTIQCILLTAGAGGQVPDGRRVGIIGLDTSHSVAFTRTLNAPDAGSDLLGYRVVAAYPKGSPDIESSVRRVPEYTQEMRKLGVGIVESIEELLDRVDVVLLETNDGRPHLEQALPVMKAGKPLFIDKPIEGNLAEAVTIFEAAEKYNVPIFSSSSLRYGETLQDVRQGSIGTVHQAFTFSPAALEPTHPDLFWYGIHGVEMLFTVMGTGCETVVRVHSEDSDVVVGRWKDGRIGTFLGMREGERGYGGRAFGEDAIVDLGSFEGYRPLLVEIARFFDTGKAPVSPEETLELYAFMAAADVSKARGGIPVSLQEVLEKARAEAPTP